MKFTNRTFEDQTQKLDGNEFIGCTFRRCKLQFGATASFALSDCRFDHVRWEFTDAAAATIQCMRILYHAGGKSLIEETFGVIRTPLT